ncbi:MAG: class I SAM-dependent methyltransferase [Pseudomonadota bacterium]
MSLPRIWRAPAIQAALIQLLSLLPMLAAVYALARLGASVSYLGVALLQGTFAAALSWWRGLAPWWRAIELLFPLAVFGALALNLPPALFLGAFLFLWLLFWSTFRTQVPYYPSSRQVWDAVARALPQGRALKVIDIGSGLGGFTLDLARRRLDAQVSGIELAPLPFWVSAARARALPGALRARVQFVRGDYEQLDFAAYDAVFAYLSPAAMPALWRKAKAQMRAGSMLFSHEFSVPGQEPTTTLFVEGRSSLIYVWTF